MSDRIYDTSAPVLVTGATGYVAGWLVKCLLDEGFIVHAAVRDPSNADKLKYLNALAEKSPGRIQYFKTDLLEPGSYEIAMQGCQVVFHTASPFIMSVENPQKDLIEPAQLGTRNVLEQANQTPSVKRVVVTSSCAAIYGDNADLGDRAAFTEEDWNTSSSVTHQPYSYSKTLAEREAWTIAQTQTQWDLVTVNPSLVIGPGINPFATSESFALIKQLGDGTMKMGAANYYLGVVDVREVAEAHMAAGFNPSASGRYITSGYGTSLPELGDILREHFGDIYPFPSRVLPKGMVWLLAPLVNKAMSRKMVSRNIGVSFHADNSKGKRELGLTYRPMKTSLIEMFQQLIDHGLITA